MPQNGDWRELKGLSIAIGQAHGTRNWEQVAKLGTTRDTLRGIIGQFDKDIKNNKVETKLKADPEFASQLKDIRDALKATIAALNEAAENNDFQQVDQLTGQARQLQNVSHNMIAADEPDAPTARARGLEQGGLLRVINAQQIMGVITTGVNTYVSHLDRSSIINQQANGNPIGAEIEELHRGAAEKNTLWGSIGGIGGAILGGIIGTFAAPGAGTVAGAALGSTLLGSLGGLVGTVTDEKTANEKSTDEARAQQWRSHAPNAMELAATFGMYGGSAAENTRSLRTAFDRAARAANEFGYSVEEGIETAKQAAAQGMSYSESLAATRKIYNFERGTGADRNTLTSVETQMARYGERNALGAAWQGNQASGLQTGQFSEFLRSMQQIFEDGISKGFVRGAKEISENLTFLSDLNNGSELWKGEQGANRLSQMNSSMEQATNLASTTDVLVYRAAQNVIKDENFDWKKLLDVDNDGAEDIIRGRGGSEYINAMMLLERGLTPELFSEQMKMFNTAERSDYASVIERMRKAYGLDYTQSAQLYKNWEQHKDDVNYFDSDAFARELEKYTAKPPGHSSAELAMFKDVETIRTKVAEIGMHYADKTASEIRTIVVRLTEEAARTDTGINLPTGDSYPDSSLAPTPIQQTLTELTSAATAPSGSGYNDNLKQAREAAIQAQVDEGRRLADMRRERNAIENKTKDATKHLFSEHFGDKGIAAFPWTWDFDDAVDERNRINVINETVKGAIASGDSAQFNAAKEFSDIISKYGKDEKTGNPYNKADTFNSLADFKDDMLGMLTALRSLTERIDNVRVYVKPE